jgi:anti-anti-sigma factor
MDPRIALITLRGALDPASQRSLRAELSAAAGDLSRALVLDLRGLTGIDSMGLAVLVHGDQQFRRQGRSMACVVREGGPLQTVLERTGMRDGLVQFRSLEDAASHVLRDGSRAGAPQP